MSAKTIYWTARNNSNFLNGYRKATSLKQAIKDARNYVTYELYCDGAIEYYDTNPNNDDTPYGPVPVRIEEHSRRTGYRWERY